MSPAVTALMIDGIGLVKRYEHICVTGESVEWCLVSPCTLHKLYARFGKTNNVLLARNVSIEVNMSVLDIQIIINAT